MFLGVYFMLLIHKSEIIPENALYAFSVRESVKSVEPDGSVVKKNVFRNLGFVEACEWPEF